MGTIGFIDSTIFLGLTAIEADLDLSLTSNRAVLFDFLRAPTIHTDRCLCVVAMWSFALDQFRDQCLVPSLDPAHPRTRIHSADLAPALLRAHSLGHHRVLIRTSHLTARYMCPIYHRSGRGAKSLKSASSRAEHSR